MVQGSLHKLCKSKEISHDDYLRSSRFPALDGLRAISVVLIFGAHFGGPAWALRAGWLGVHAFFVLSGFLITTLLLRERDATGAISLKAFYIRRAMRLLPAYFLVFLLVLGLSYFKQGEDWEQMKAASPYHLALSSDWAAFSPFGMAWTLGIEWKYYAVWSLMLAAFGTTNRACFSMAGVGLFLLAVVWSAGLASKWFLPWHYLGVVVGSLVAIGMHAKPTFKCLQHFNSNTTSVVIALCLLLVHWRSGSISARIGEGQMIAVYAVLVGLWLPSLLAQTMIGRTLASRALAFVGQRSYGLYLLQYVAWQIFLALFPQALVGPLAMIGNFFIALLLSDLLYRSLERPLVSIGQRLAGNAKRRDQAGVVGRTCQSPDGSKTSN